jgi:hypothetical protein
MYSMRFIKLNTNVFFMIKKCSHTILGWFVNYIRYCKSYIGFTWIQVTNSRIDGEEIILIEDEEPSIPF